MSQVTLTKEAAYEVKHMLEKNDMAGGYLRFKVQGGGCTGLTYGMSAEDKKNDNDLEFEYYGVKLIIDQHDIPVVDGTVIGYKQSLLGGGFTIDNPLASLSCGCGASFRTNNKKGTPSQC